jgi:hypothetical protein
MIPWLIVEVTIGIVSFAVGAACYLLFAYGVLEFNKASNQLAPVTVLLGVEPERAAVGDAATGVLLLVAAVMLVVIGVKAHFIGVVASYKSELEKELRAPRSVAMTVVSVGNNGFVRLDDNDQERQQDINLHLDVPVCC